MIYLRKVFACHLGQNVVKIFFIVHIDQTIVEDSLRLVIEQSGDGVLVSDRLRPHLQHALNALGQISQVEHIMRFGRRGQQFSAHAAIDLDRGVHNLVGATFHSKIEIAEEALRYRLEYMFETVIGRRWYAEHAKVSDESKRYGISSSAWWSTGGRYSHVLDLNKRHAFFAATVKAAKVLVLSEELDGRLRAVRV